MDSFIGKHFTFDDEPDTPAKILVVGIGGGGGNAINNMIEKGIQGVDFVAINTDAQALAANKAPIKIQAGRNITKGLGAGARPSVGAEAVMESREEIEAVLKGYDMVFLAAGMGGGTGTGGAAVVAEIARRLNILTVAVVTKPFQFEGKQRMKQALEGIRMLREFVDTLVVIPNQKLLAIADEDTSLKQAFLMADEVLYNATRGISDLITVHGLVNLDFADVRTTMENGGTALMGSAVASGENRAERAAREAISSPLLDGLSIQGARNVLVNITASSSLKIREAEVASSLIQQAAGEDVEVIWGTVIDEEMGDELRITVIATGFEEERAQAPKKERRIYSLDKESPPVPYKGSENLKRLDQPAFERRGEEIKPEKSVHKPEDGEKTPRIRKLRLEERREPPEDIDMPRFLRKMLD